MGIFVVFNYKQQDRSNTYMTIGSHLGRDRMAVGFTTTYAFIVYQYTLHGNICRF